MKSFLRYKVKISISLSIFFISFLCNAVQIPKYDVNVVTEILDPYQMYNDEGQLDGLSTDIVKALFKQANAKANIKVMPWPRAYIPMILQDEILHLEVSWV